MTLKDFLHTKDDISLRKLPLYHSTPFVNADNILAIGIIPSECKFFNENLAYYFYGRSSYSKKGDERLLVSKLNDQDLGVCFSIELDALEENNIFKIFPFDSGAYKDEMYEKHIPHIRDISIYEMEKSQLNKYINTFFGDLNGYVQGNTLDIKSGDDEIKSLNKLLLENDLSGPLDMRRRTIEVSTKQTVKNKKIKYIFLHTRHKNKPAVKKFLNEFKNVKPYYYTTDEVETAYDIYKMLRNRVGSFTEEEILNE